MAAHDTTPTSPAESAPGRDFIRQIIDEDNRTGKWGGRVHTRFPPEPNGYLHLGHAKSICLNFGLAQEFGGQCNLRFDDTNPAKEEVEYVDSIQNDVRWLGFSWDDRMFYASNYFDQLYAFAEQLIEKGLAYVDDQSQEEIRATRGTLTEPGTESPYRNRTAGENLDLFRRMSLEHATRFITRLREDADFRWALGDCKDAFARRRFITLHGYHFSPAELACVTGRSAAPCPERAARIERARRAMGHTNFAFM